MKTIIAGSRGIEDFDVVAEAVRLSGFAIREVVSGGARGVDRLGELWAARAELPCKVFPADWNKHGRAAGPIRNREMANYADSLVAVWDGKSRGTRDMIEVMKQRGMRVFVYEPHAEGGEIG